MAVREKHNREKVSLGFGSHERKRGRRKGSNDHRDRYIGLNIPLL